MTLKQDKPDPPLDDMSKMRRLMELDQRSLAAMFMLMPGKATETGVAEWKEIHAGYEDLLRAGAPKDAFYTLDSVRKKMADTTDSIARSYDSLNNLEQAKLYYEQAAQSYEEIGDHDKANRCRNHIAQIRLSDEGNLDDELLRLQTMLESVPKNSLQHAQLLIDLGELYIQMSDDDEAEKLLTVANRELDELGGNPAGANLGDALAQSLSSILEGKHAGGPTPIETQTLMRGLYRRLYLALAQIYRELDADKAAAYLAQARQLDSKELNEDFSKRMLEALSGDLGKLL